LKSKIQRCNYGLPIRGTRKEPLFDTIELNPEVYSTVFDGLPEGYENIGDFLEAFDPDYRDFVKRRFTFGAYLNTEVEEMQERYERDLINSIAKRAQIGQEQERINMPHDVDFFQTKLQSERVDRQRSWIRSNLLQSGSSDFSQFTKGISGSPRYILERGKEAEPIFV
jgi:hypothetical protein